MPVTHDHVVLLAVDRPQIRYIQRGKFGIDQARTSLVVVVYIHKCHGGSGISQFVDGADLGRFVSPEVQPCTVSPIAVQTSIVPIGQFAFAVAANFTWGACNGIIGIFRT